MGEKNKIKRGKGKGRVGLVEEGEVVGVVGVEGGRVEGGLLVCKVTRGHSFSEFKF